MKRKSIIIGSVVAVVLVIAAAIAGVSSHMKKVTSQTEFFTGVQVEGIELGGLSKEEAQTKLDEYWNQLTATEVELVIGEKTEKITLGELGVSYSNQEILTEAYALGREGSLFQNYLDIKNLEKEPANYELEFVFDDAALQNALKEKTSSYEDKMQNASIKRVNGAFVITEEKDGVVFNYEESAKLISDKVANDWADRASFTIEMVTQIEKAQYTKEMMEKITDKIGTFSTSYSSSASGRKKNVKAGASFINGNVIYPGETFSVHDVVTPFTYARGYAMAGSYLNGETVESMGGGICQVSTTLYNAVLRAELEIVERHEHSMTVAYVQLSADAAIAGTYKDLKFKNNLDTPIYIEGIANGSTLTFTIWGEETRPANRSISFVNEVLSTTSPTEKEEKDPTLEEGVRKVISKGHTGYKTKLWKIVKVDGKQTDKILVNSSSYMMSPTKVAVGTKKVEATTQAPVTTAPSTEAPSTEAPSTQAPAAPQNPSENNGNTGN